MKFFTLLNYRFLLQNIQFFQNSITFMFPSEIIIKKKKKKLNKNWQANIQCDSQSFFNLRSVSTHMKNIQNISS